MDSIFQTNETNKSEDFRSNYNLNEILQELSYFLKPIQQEKQNQFKKNKYPLAFIIGNPRSGTTLFLQWLASLEVFSYPTNVLNRFAYAPYIGALVQDMLFNPEFDFNNEFNSINTNQNFESDLGKSKGALSVSEFQHFFRNYMPNFDPEYLDDKTIKDVDLSGIKQGLASIENVFKKPFVMKGTMLQFNINSLFSEIPNSIFFYIKRDSLLNMQSLLIARERYYSDINIWWSVKPKEFKFLKEMDVYHQIAGQVYFTNKSIDEELDKLPDENKMIIQYENFCKNPKNIFDQIKNKYDKKGFLIHEEYSSVESFSISQKIKLDNNTLSKLEKAYLEFENNNY